MSTVYRVWQLFLTLQGCFRLNFRTVSLAIIVAFPSLQLSEPTDLPENASLFQEKALLHESLWIISMVCFPSVECAVCLCSGSSRQKRIITSVIGWAQLEFRSNWSLSVTSQINNCTWSVTCLCLHRSAGYCISSMLVRYGRDPHYHLENCSNVSA